jgi:hypothetical protein
MMDLRPYPGPVHVLVLAVLLVLAVMMWKAGVPLLVEVWTGNEEDRIRIVAAVITVSGTLVSAIVGVLLFHSQQRAREREREVEAQRIKAKTDEDAKHYRWSVAAALRSEIRESLDRLSGQFTHEAIIRQLEAFAKGLEDDPNHGMPRGVAMEENIIFDAHRDKIFEMPEELVRALVRYYQNDRYLNRYLHNMSEGRFADISPDRQKRAIAYYLDVGRTAYLAAIRARVMLDAYILVYHDEVINGLDGMTLERATKCFTQFPGDDHIAEMLGESERELFKAEVAKDCDGDADTRFNAYLSALGLTQ